MIGRKIIELENINSTNDYIKAHFKELDDGTIVVAKRQWAGRGRSNHQWKSELGNLYFSFIIKKKIVRDELFMFTVLSSMAVINLLKNYKINAVIKYPNDILVNNKKICGILTESSGSKEIDHVVIGIGINVNQEDFQELNSLAVSIKQITKQDYQVKQILKDFIQEYNLLEETSYLKGFNAYLKASLIIGKKIIFEGMKYEISGIKENGEIIIKNEKHQKAIILNSINIKELS